MGWLVDHFGANVRVWMWLWGHFGVTFDVWCRLWGHFGVTLGWLSHMRVTLKQFWGRFGLPFFIWGWLWGHFGWLLDLLGWLWSQFGANLGSLIHPRSPVITGCWTCWKNTSFTRSVFFWKSGKGVKKIRIACSMFWRDRSQSLPSPVTLFLCTHVNKLAKRSSRHRN